MDWKGCNINCERQQQWERNIQCLTVPDAGSRPSRDLPEKRKKFSFALRLSEKLPLTVRFEATVHAEASSFILLGNWLKLFIKNCIHKSRCVVIHQIKHRLQHKPAGCIIRIHICLLQCNQFRWVRGKKYHNFGELSVPCRNTKSSNFGMWRQKSSQPD